MIPYQLLPWQQSLSRVSIAVSLSSIGPTPILSSSTDGTSILFGNFFGNNRCLYNYAGIMDVKLPRGARTTLINAQYRSKVAAAHHHRPLLLGLVFLIVCVHLLPSIWRVRGKCDAASG